MSNRKSFIINIPNYLTLMKKLNTTAKAAQIKGNASGEHQDKRKTQRRQKDKLEERNAKLGGESE